MHTFPDSLHCIYLPRIIPGKICCQKFKLPSLMVSVSTDAIAAATVRKDFLKFQALVKRSMFICCSYYYYSFLLRRQLAGAPEIEQF